MKIAKFDAIKTNKLLMTVIVIGIVAVLLAAILFIAKMDSLKAIISGHNGDQVYGGAITDSVPEISGNGNVIRSDVYLDKDIDDIFSYVDERSSYVREFQIITSYNGVQTINQIKLYRSGDNYRSESVAKDVVYSSGKMQITSDVYSSVIDADVSDFYSEVGITPLDKIIEIASTDSTTVTVSDDRKTIYVNTATDSNNNFSIYEISVENGIVTYEAHYHNGQIIRTITTDSVDTMIGKRFPDNLFTISNLN